MAEKIIKLSTSPEITKSSGGILRRYSTGLPNLSNSGGEEILPHYLRASIGSCHDFCKYGKKHDTEKKARRPIRKRIPSLPTASDGQNSVEIFVLEDRKKLPIVLKDTSESKSLLAESTKIVKQEVSSPSKKIVTSVKQVASNSKEINLPAKVATSLKPKPTPVKPLSSPNSSAASSGRRNSITNNASSLKLKPATVKLVFSPNSSADSSGRRNSIANNASSLMLKPATVKPVFSPNSSADSSGRRNSIANNASSLMLKPATVKPVFSPNSSADSSGRRNSIANNASSLMLKPAAVKPVFSPNSSAVKPVFSPNSSAVKPVFSPNSSADSSGRRNSIASNASLLKLKPATVKPVSSPSAGSSGRRNSNAKNTKEANVLVNRVTSLKPKPVTVKSSSSANAWGSSSGRRGSDIKIGKKTGASRGTLKKTLALPTASLLAKPKVANSKARKSGGLKIVPTLKNQNRSKVEHKQPNNEIVQEKTLYVITVETAKKPLLFLDNGNPAENETLASAEKGSPIESKTLVYVENGSPTENKTLLSVENGTPVENITLESAENGSPNVQSSPSVSSSPKSSSTSTSLSLLSHEEEDEDESESEYTDTDGEADDSILENNDTVNMEKTETGKYKRTRKVGMLLSEDKDGNPVKLSFRRGKVVDLQSVINSPRRLRFRRGRVLGDNQYVKGEAQKKNFKNRGVDSDKDGANPGSQKVVLRHQDVQGKKDAQGLFNNVIEETASKLVETRRSKVQALVGAFETVISLQDRKPSTHTLS